MKVSNRTQRRLADLFAVLALNEKNLNEARIALSKARGYDLEALFHRLDFHHRSLVNFEDLLRFFEINCIDASKDEAIWLIEQIIKDKKNNTINSSNFQKALVDIDQFREFIKPMEIIKKEQLGKDVKKGVTFQQESKQVSQPNRSNLEGAQQQQKIDELNMNRNNSNSNSNSSLDRYSKQNVNPIPSLDPETEYVLVKLLKECLNGQKQRLSKQTTLSSCTDFDLERLFKAVDSENIDQIDNRTLAQFVQRKERNLSEKEASRLIEVYGDNLGKYLNINHFAKIIGVSQPQQEQKQLTDGQTSIVDLIIGNNQHIPIQSQEKVEGIEQRTSDQRISVNQIPKPSQQGINSTGVEARNSSSTSSFKNEIINNNKDITSTSLASQNNKPEKQQDQSRRLYQVKQLYSAREIEREMDAAEEDNFSELLANWMQSDISKEDFKEELMSERDFSLYGAFKFLDIANRGRLTAEEIFARLYQLGVPLSKESVYMLFKEYDVDFSGKLDFQEFCRTLSPLSVEHSLAINNRVLPNGIEMSRSTQMMLLDTLNCILENARYSEALRQLLNKRNGFSPYQAFCMLDTNRNGYITPQDFREFFVAHNRHFSIKEIMHFFRRFDKQLEGQLTYGTFFAELAPKAPFVVGINKEEIQRNNQP